MRWVRDHIPHPVNKRLYRDALLVTITGNVTLAVVKSLAAYFSGSVAIFSDAANSISDVLYSLLMVLGLYVSQRPPDLSHPQGHSRFEPLVGLMVSFSMAFAGYSALRASFVRFQEGGLAVEPGLPMLVLALSAAAKVGMFYSIRAIAKKLTSPTLNTAARDNLSDVLASSAAFIGALGSTRLHPLLDPAAGVVVSLWIFYAAFAAARENLNFLTGAGASEELRQRIIEETCAVPGVLRVHHLMTEYAGPRLVADLHANVDGSTTLTESHRITDEIIARIEAMPEIDRAYVHLEPHDWEE
jgi:cation diffusion facilitator family transporter